MSDGSQYHLRRGKTPGLVDDVASPPRGAEGEGAEVMARTVTPIDVGEIELPSRPPTPARSIDPRAITGAPARPGDTRPITMTPSRSMDPRTITPAHPARVASATQPPRTMTPPTVTARTTTPPVVAGRTPTPPVVAARAPTPPTVTARTTTPPPVQARTATLTQPPRPETALTRARTMTAPVPSIAQGSAPDLVPLGIDLDDLADVPANGAEVPVIERTPATFGPNQLIVEYHADRVAIVLPGVVRLIGSVEDGRRLAELLARRPR